ncbi:aliphatic sulfonate ABC transporter substrate-binding protein [Eubacterium oxidoreducens]|uniref:Sulfonate transport system substrate-binding protein n=1 Tax=Eubacterium oxidoreducens TaxID=1732 RepID=A0A1G6A2I7_EUBOX|nr:aliphatic sulfonate ABC transporter substrate-binding protein [Eubacterium oxidoreducens]SDB02627.1 sulfonate transport system substrate-binding protein [Eubacterium oxidoreducens]
MKKKLLSLLLVTGMLTGLVVGCGSTTASNDGETSTASTEEAESDEDATAEGASTVNIAIQPSGAFIPLIIAREEGWLEEALADYGVEVVWNDFESGPPINESMAADLSDIGTLGDVPTVSAIAAGQDNQVISIAAEGEKAYAILTAADSDIASIADLEGKTIATTLGSTGHNLFEKALETEGLTFDNVNLINISAGDAGTVLSTGEADAVAIWEPNVTRLVENGTAKVLTYGGDVGLLGVNPLVADSKFVEENPEVIKVIIEQYARGVAEIENISDETLSAVAEYLSLDEDQVLTVASNWDYTVDITQDDIDSLQDTISFLVTIGTLTEEYSIEDYVNTDLISQVDYSQYKK